MKLSACFAAAIMALAVCGPARASELFDLGTTFTITGANAPDAYTAMVTLGAGPTVIDNGAVTVTQSFMTNPDGSEWISIDLLGSPNGTTNPPYIYGSTSNNWLVSATGIHFSQLVTGITGYYAFGIACAGVSCGFPTIGGCWTGPGTCTIIPNPFATFEDAYQATVSGTGNVFHFQIGVNPFGALTNNGAYSAFTVGLMDEYQFGFEVEAAATPVPAALPLFASGLGALGLLGWRRKQKARAAA